MAPRVRWLLLISVCLIAVVGSYWKWLAIEPRDDLLHHPTSPILDSGPLQIPMERQPESDFIQTLKLDNHSGLPASAANWVDTIYQLNQSNPSCIRLVSNTTRRVIRVRISAWYACLAYEICPSLAAIGFL